MFNYTFPADFTGTFRGQPLAGTTCVGGAVLDYGSEEVNALMVEFSGTKLGPSPRRSVNVTVPADADAGLLALARADIDAGFAISESHGAGWPIEYVNLETGTEIALGRIVPEDESVIPCTVRCQRRVDGTGWFRGSVFAVVDHPAHGRIAVSPVEFLALGLSEVPGRQ